MVNLMFYVEYTEYDQRKALNLAMCQTIETQVSHTGGRKSTYALIIQHEKLGKKVINFKTEEELLSTFDDLMNALKSYQAHWMSPKPLHHVSSQT